MSDIIQFRKFGNRAIQKAREQRVSDSKKDDARFKQSWEKNEDIEKVRHFRSQQKLNSLMDYALGKNQDVGDNVEFSKNMNEAEDFVSMLAGERPTEDDEEEKTFSVKAELLNTDNKLVDLSEVENEDWASYELAESDKFLMANLIKSYGDKTI